MLFEPYKNLMLLIALSPGRCLRAGEPPLLCGCVCLTSRGETRLKPIFQLWRRELYMSFTRRQPPPPSHPAASPLLFPLLSASERFQAMLAFTHILPIPGVCSCSSDGSSCIVRLQIPQPASKAVTRELCWPEP